MTEEKKQILLFVQDDRRGRVSGIVNVQSFVDSMRGGLQEGNSERRAGLFLMTACASSSRGFVSGEAVVRRVVVVRDETPGPPDRGD